MLPTAGITAVASGKLHNECWPCTVTSGMVHIMGEDAAVDANWAWVNEVWVSGGFLLGRAGFGNSLLHIEDLAKLRVKLSSLVRWMRRFAWCCSASCQRAAAGSSLQHAFTVRLLAQGSRMLQWERDFPWPVPFIPAWKEGQRALEKFSVRSWCETNPTVPCCIQSHTALNQSGWTGDRGGLPTCSADVQSWLVSRFLKLQPSSKKDFLHFQSTFLIDSVNKT